MAKVPQTAELPNSTEIQTQVRTLRTELNDLVARGKLNGTKAKELAEKYISSLPNELKTKIRDEEGLITKLASIMSTMDSSKKDRALQQQELDAAITKIGLTLLGHLSEKITLSVNLPNGEHVPNIDSQILTTDSRTRLRVKAGAGTAVMVISGLTSFMAGYTWTGKGMEAAVTAYPWLEQFEAINDPTVRTCINFIGGVLGGIVITQAALSSFRSGAEKISYQDNVGFLSAARRNLGKIWKTSALGASLTIGALSLDVMTNADGIVSLTAGNIDEAKQILEAKAAIQDAVAATRDHVNKLPGQVAQQANAAAQDLLTKEAGGKSETGAAGKGPIYAGKAALVGGDTTVTIPTTPIGIDVRQALSVTNLDNDAYPTIGAHLSTVVTDTAKPIEGILKDIEAKVNTLDAGKNVEINQSVLKGVKARFDKIQDILKAGGDVETKLQEVLREYNEAFAEIGKVAQKHYPSYTAGSLANVPLPELTLTLPQVEVKSFEWKSSINLINELLEKGETGMALFWLVISLMGGILSSYGDEILDELTPEGKILGKRVRTSHKEDRENSEKGSENLEKIRKARVASLHALLNGPFANVLHSKGIHPGLIEEALDAEVDSMLEPEKNPLPQEVTGLRVQIARLCGDTWNSFIGNPFKTYVTGPLSETWQTLGRGDTKEVIDFNKKVRAYQLTGSPSGLLNVIARILISTDKNIPKATAENDKHIEAENTRLITAELTKLRNNTGTEVPEVAPSTEYRTTIETLLSGASRNLAELEDIHTYGIPNMASEKAAITVLCRDLISRGVDALHDSLIQECDAITLTEKIEDKDVVTKEAVLRAEASIQGLLAELEAIKGWDRNIFNAAVFNAHEHAVSTKRTAQALQAKRAEITLEKGKIEDEERVEADKQRELRLAEEAETAYARLIEKLEGLYRGKDDAPKERANRLLLAFFSHIPPITTIREDDRQADDISTALGRLNKLLSEIKAAADLNGETTRSSQVQKLQAFVASEQGNLANWIKPERTR